MKLVRYQSGGGCALGVLCQDGACVLPLSALSLSRPFASMLELIEYATESDLAAIRDAQHTMDGGVPLNRVRLLAPIEHPRHDVLCVGVNYLSHLIETHKGPGEVQKPAHSVYFGKRVHKMTGPDETIEGHLDLDECLDYEVELAIIIGKTCRDVPLERAEEVVFGYSVFNDVSARTLQNQHGQWFKGKSLDGFATMGPCIVHKSALPFPVHVDVECRVNGKVRQHANTSTLLASVPQLICDLSRGMTLEPGDIIATGTPAGVALGMETPDYLRAGDVVECEITGIGVLSNRIG